MPNPIETVPSGESAELAARLPLATAAGSPGRPGAEVVWGGPLAPSDALVDAVAAAFGVALRTAADGPDPGAHPAFRALFASARAEQVVRQLSSRTNLALAGTTAVVVGDGPLAERLTRTLTRIGVRVLRATDDPLVRLDAELAGLGHVPVSASGSTGAHYILLTGEGTAPIAAATLEGVVVDASADGGALDIGATRDASRPGVRIEGRARIVELDPPLPSGVHAGSGLQWRVLDALVALSILTARGEADRLATLALERRA